MTTPVSFNDGGQPTLTALLRELAGVFLERDDLLETVTYQQDIIDGLHTKIDRLQESLDVARRSFGDAFVYGDTTVGPERPNRHKLSKEQAVVIRRNYKEYPNAGYWGRQFGVHRTTINRIVNGTYYA